MGTTVIDAFVTTLGLDGTLFKRGMKEAQDAQDKLDRNTKRSNQDREKSERDAARERAKRQKELDEQNKKTLENYKKIRNELLSITALFTAGMGFKDFLSNTISTAANLGYLSKNLSMTTQQLTSWQRATERAGGSAEGIIAQLKESQDTLAQLRSGFGPNEGLQNFFRFGGNKDDIKDGNTYLLARARIIANEFKKDPAQAAFIAKQMGVSEDQFNFLKQGPDEVMRLVHAQEKNAAITEKDAEKARELREKWLDLTDSLQATTVKILTALLPSFNKLAGVILKLTGHITDNKDKIAEWVGKIADFDWSSLARDAKEFASDIKSITSNLRELIDRWDEWTGRSKVQTPGVTKLPGALRFGKKEDLDRDNVATGRAPSKSTGRPENKTLAKINDVIEEGIARTLASFGVQSAKEWIRDNTGHDDYLAGPKANPKAKTDVQSKLISMGWTREQAAGIAASFMQESDLDPRKVNPKSGAYGIGQWLAPRRADFKAWSGKDIQGSTIEEQLQFFQYEVTKGKEQEAGRLLRAAKNAEDAARIHSEAYERPGSAEANIARRQRLAKQLATSGRVANAASVGTIPSGAAASVFATGASSTSTNTTDVKIDNITINTSATDAQGVAKAIRPAIEKYTFATQANTGIR